MAAPLAAELTFLDIVAQEVTIGYFFPLALFSGVTEASLDLALPRNALVDELRLRVQAQRVDLNRLQDVAQVRSYVAAGVQELVIDFGTARTVSAIHLPGGVTVSAVYPWLGSQFSPSAAFFGSASSTTHPLTSHAVFPEVRSERLRVLISRALSNDEMAQVQLRLPEPPSGLSLDIDQAPPVWSHAEPVQPRSNVATPDDAGWDAESRRVLPLAEAFAPLTADPLADDTPVNFKLTLRSAVPCRLALTLESPPCYRRIRRQRFAADTATTLVFDSEGAIDLPLSLPAPPSGATLRIDELRWLASAELGSERVLPPLGPEVAAGSGADTPLLADLVVDAQRAVLVRLPAGSGLAELTAVRLPLAAGADGAEARVLLWPVDPAQPDALPAAASPQGSSKPLTLDAAAAPAAAASAASLTGTLPAAERWLRFDFNTPQPLDDAAPPWLALVAARGSLSWALGRANAVDAADPINAQQLRRGPPNGPWQALPAPLQSATGVLDARGRLRLVGTAPKAAPLAPLLFSIGSAPALPFTPTAKGVPGQLAPAGGVQATGGAVPPLRIVSRVAGSLTLRDLDVVSNL